MRSSLLLLLSSLDRLVTYGEETERRKEGGEGEGE
jgi:hypothetical protein